MKILDLLKRFGLLLRFFMPEKLNKETVVAWWTRIAIKDFFIAFYLNNKFPWYSTFFYHQGLEKICKAYLLGTLAEEYESRPVTKAKTNIDRLAKDKKKMGHNLKDMINKLISINVLHSNVLTKEYAKYDGASITGERIIEVLESAYLECRYPIPYAIHKKYPIKNKKGKKIGYWDPIGSSEPKTFAYDLGLEIMKKIEQNFKVNIPKNKFRTSIDDGEWKRFSRIFFKVNCPGIL
jgi:hypothetical protein